MEIWVKRRRYFRVVSNASLFTIDSALRMAATASQSRQLSNQ